MTSGISSSELALSPTQALSENINVYVGEYKVKAEVIHEPHLDDGNYFRSSDDKNRAVSDATWLLPNVPSGLHRPSHHV